MPLPTTSNIPHPRGQGFAVAIDSALFRPAYGPGRELQIETAPLEPPALDTRTNPEELNEEFGRTFGRDDFTGGEGLDYAHTRAERVNKESRFFDSRNIDITPPDAGDTREIRLLHTTAAVDTPTPALPRFAYTTALYYPSGTTLRKSANPTAATPVWADDDPHSGEAATTVNDVTVLGTNVYAALGVNGIHRYTSSWAHWSDIQATRVWTAKSRVIAAAGTALYEAAAGAAPSPLYTLPTGATWNDVVDAGEAILACASDGNIYAFAPDTTTGVLRQYAQTRIEGETPTALGVAQGVVFYGTSEPNGAGATGRLWRAELSEALTVVNGQLLKEWESDTLDRAPRRITATRDAVFTAVIEDAGETHAWRYDLATSGLSRSYVFSASGVAYGLVMLAGKLWAGIGGATVRRQTDVYAAEGWLIGPFGDFFSSSIKSWYGARLNVAPLPTGASVTLQYALDIAALSDAEAAAWRTARTVDSNSALLDSETQLAGISSRGLAGQIRLTPASGFAETPAVRSFAFRAYPGGSGAQDKTIAIPINISDQLERPNKRGIRVKGWGSQVYAALRAFEGQTVSLRLYRPDMTMRGLIESVGAPIPAVSERGSPTLYAIVKFRGREALNYEVSEAAGGVGALGIVGMGT